MTSSIQLCFQIEVNNPFFPISSVFLLMCFNITRERWKDCTVHCGSSDFPSCCWSQLVFLWLYLFFFLITVRKESAALIPGVSSPFHKQRVTSASDRREYLPEHCDSLEHCDLCSACGSKRLILQSWTGWETFWQESVCTLARWKPWKKNPLNYYSFENLTTWKGREHCVLCNLNMVSSALEVWHAGMVMRKF